MCIAIVQALDMTTTKTTEDKVSRAHRIVSNRIEVLLLSWRGTENEHYSMEVEGWDNKDLTVTLREHESGDEYNYRVILERY